MSQIGQRTTGGLVQLSVTTGGTGYTAPPTVAFSGGSGTGASAVAHMAGTLVESVVITNAGTGYTSNPTVSLSGGVHGLATTDLLLQGPFQRHVRRRWNGPWNSLERNRRQR